MNQDGRAGDMPGRDEVAAMATADLRNLLATTHDSTIAGWAIRELPVVPEDGREHLTVEAVGRAVDRFDTPPCYAIAEYIRRLDTPEQLGNHPGFIRAVLREGPIHDDNIVHDVTRPIDVVDSQDQATVGQFIDDLVTALDREPKGHEGATSLLETIRRVQFAESEVERDEYVRPNTRISAQPVSLSDQATAVADHADSIAAVMARQPDPNLAHTPRTATSALVVLHGIAATDPVAVAEHWILQQVVRVLREFSPRSLGFDEARGVILAVSGAQPAAVTPHVDLLVASVAAGLRAAEPAPKHESVKTATRRLALVVDLLKTHPEQTVEAANWASLRSAFANAGPATRGAGGALLDAAEDSSHPLGRAFLLRLVAVAARKSPETFASQLDRVDAIGEATTVHENDGGPRSQPVDVENAANAVRRAVEGGD
jgi:hypothetical protein